MPFGAPFVAIAVAPGVAGFEHDDEAGEDEGDGPDIVMEVGIGVVVLQEEEAADGHEDEPAAAAEVMAEADEEAEGYEEDMPVEEPVGEGEVHLVEEEHAANE
jgi:hypothetical protein